MRPQILVVVGTRPEAIKLAPVISRLRASGAFSVTVCATGQHRGLLDDALAAFQIRPEIDLDLMRADQRPGELAGRLIAALDRLLRDRRPDWVIVQGDTVTTAAAAQAAFYARVPVAHVEAGLRSGDPARPFPEEGNRRLVAALARLHFAPTENARDNLLSEGVDARQVHVTGNTGIDALVETAATAAADPGIAVEMQTLFAAQGGGGRLIDEEKHLLLVTCHRRESIGPPMARICAALRRLAAREDVRIVLPLHPNPRVAERIRPQLAGVPGIALLDPLDYRRFVWLLARARLVLTDSGGLQEEAPALGRPVLVLREVTERPEAVAAGGARLVGTETGRIIAETNRLLDDPAAYAAMARPRFPFGDGHAAERIVSILARTALCG